MTVVFIHEISMTPLSTQELHDDSSQHVNMHGEISQSPSIDFFFLFIYAILRFRASSWGNDPRDHLDDMVIFEDSFCF